MRLVEVFSGKSYVLSIKEAQTLIKALKIMKEPYSIRWANKINQDDLDEKKKYLDKEFRRLLPREYMDGLFLSPNTINQRGYCYRLNLFY